jgi:AmmeMemoRadiSam system protein B
MAMGIRKPAVAGQFYEASQMRLEKQLHDSFIHDKGPGDLPSKRGNPVIKAIISPHAGYTYSAPCAAWGYKEIAEAKLPDTFIILGVDHTGYGKTALSTDSWETPLGLMRVDNQLANQIMQKAGIPDDPGAHSMEHSIEVQIPFLQFANKAEMEKLRFIPITVSHDKDLKQLAIDIMEAIMDLNRIVTFIASSDFTHYGRNYRYLPFTSEVPKRLNDLDGGAIKLIKELNADGFAKYIDETMATICGTQTIYLLLSMLKKTKGELLQYYQSGDLTGDYKNTVGYASIVFR